MSERVSATLTRQQAADYLNIGLSLLDKMVSRRENPIPHVRVGRRIVIPVKKLDAWIEAETERETGGGLEV